MNPTKHLSKLDIGKGADEILNSAHSQGRAFLNGSPGNRNKALWINGGEICVPNDETRLGLASVRNEVYYHFGEFGHQGRTPCGDIFVVRYPQFRRCTSSRSHTSGPQTSWRMTSTSKSFFLSFTTRPCGNHRRITVGMHDGLGGVAP